jgi:uncharacterized membrane protein
MTDIHRFVGYSIPTGFAILTLWAVVSLIRNRNPHDLFWQLLAALQVVIGIQVIVGGILFLGGSRPASNGPQWLHYVYGALFPAAVLVAAHRFARSERWRQIPWAVFGFAALICFGLTFRALQTGLGID